MRSGTSMWMQILQAAGLDSIGTAFPGYWEEALGAYNPRGFHESRLREGVWWRTNPHPETGAFLAPEPCRRHVVKVFIGGLIRTDLAYIDQVVVTMRDWRSFTRSFASLHETEKRWREENDSPFPQPTTSAPLPIRWWIQNYELVRDIATRRHRALFLTYDRVQRQPAREVGRVLDWLEIDDPQRRANAIAAVEPKMRSERPPSPEEDLIPRELTEVFDRLYATVDAGEPIGPALITQMNDTHRLVLGGAWATG